MSAAFLTFPTPLPNRKHHIRVSFNHLSRGCHRPVNKQEKVSLFPIALTAPAKNDFARLAATTALATAFIINPIRPSHSVPGGGQDYASKDYTNADFSGGSYEGKDFSGATQRGSTFRNAKLKITRFF